MNVTIQYILSLLTALITFVSPESKSAAECLIGNIEDALMSLDTDATHGRSPVKVVDVDSSRLKAEIEYLENQLKVKDLELSESSKKLDTAELKKAPNVIVLPAGSEHLKPLLVMSLTNLVNCADIIRKQGDNPEATLAYLNSLQRLETMQVLYRAANNMPASNHPYWGVPMPVRRDNTNSCLLTADGLVFYKDNVPVDVNGKRSNMEKLREDFNANWSVGAIKPFPECNRYIAIGKTRPALVPPPASLARGSMPKQVSMVAPRPSASTKRPVSPPTNPGPIRRPGTPTDVPISPRLENNAAMRRKPLPVPQKKPIVEQVLEPDDYQVAYAVEMSLNDKVLRDSTNHIKPIRDTPAFQKFNGLDNVFGNLRNQYPHRLGVMQGSIKPYVDTFIERTKFIAPNVAAWELDMSKYEKGMIPTTFVRECLGVQNQGILARIDNNPEVKDAIISLVDRLA